MAKPRNLTLRGRKPKGVKVQIGRRPVQRWKGGGQITEYGVQITEETTKGAGGKEPKGAKVQIGRRPVQK